MNSSRKRIGLRFVGMGLNALTYAVAARALSATDMGIWALATALTSIAMSLDWGLSSHLRNRLAGHPADGAEGDYMAVFSLCLLLALAYAVLLIVGGAWAMSAQWPWVGWWTPLRLTLATAVLLGAGLLIVRMPFNLASNAFYSFHEPDLPIFWEVLNFSISFVLVALALACGAGPVLAALAFLAGGTLSAVGCTLQLMHRRRWRLRWRWPQHALQWLRGARAFGVLQLVGLGLNTLPSFVVGSLVRVEEVTVARAAMILCQAVLSLHLAHAMPLWTEFSVLRGQLENPERMASLRKRLRQESGLLLLAFGALAVALPLTIGLWLGRPASAGVTTAFCFWGAGCGVANLYSLILNGGNRPLLTTAALVPGTALAAGLAWWLAPGFGSAGVAAGFATGAGLSALLMIALARRLMTPPPPQPS